MLSKLVFLLIFPVFFSCKLKKEEIASGNSSSPVRPVGLSKDSLFVDITSKQANFSTLSIRAKANFEIDNEQHNANMSIRIEKDKAIWISVTAVAGLEIARVLISPDSLKIINRVENTYTRKPFSYVFEFANKELNFNSLQSIFAGNAIPGFLNDKSTVSLSGKSSVLSGSLGSLIYALTFNENLRVTETNVKDDNAKQSLSIVYKDFVSVSQQKIPQSVHIKSSTVDKNIAIDLKYTRVNVNVSVDLPFSVPQRFEVIN